MTKSLQEARTTTAPKRRFAFKKPELSAPTAHLGPSESSTAVGWPLKSDKPTDETNGSPSQPVSQQLLPQMSKAHAGLRLSQLRTAHYVLAPPIIDRASTASLEDLQESFIDMSMPGLQEDSFAALMVHHVQECLVICGNIAGSAHMTDVSNSTVVISARQIRLHDCNDVVLYLQCSSRPIIEDCKDIRFAPLPRIFEVLSPQPTF